MRELNICFRCLGKHLASNCDSNVKCEECQGKHLTILHNENYKHRRNANSTASPPSKNTTPNSSPKKVLCTTIGRGHSVNCSKTLLVELSMVSCPNKKIVGYAILDEQSNTTLVDEKILDLFGEDFPTLEYSMKFASQDCELKTSGKLITGLQVRGIFGDEIIPIDEALSCSNIADTTSEVASPQMVREHHSISNYARFFPDIRPEAEVLILIGRNCGRAMATECLTTTEPYVHRTPLGYTIVGKLQSSKKDSKSLKVLQTVMKYDPVQIKYDFTKKNLHFDTSSVHPDDDAIGLSNEDRKFMSIMTIGLRITGTGKIELPMPLKRVDLPNNRNQVYHRTVNTLSRIKREPLRLKACLESIQTSLDSDFIEVVPDNEAEVAINETWYLPVFCINQKTKYRLVFDASARYGGISLNDVLYQGPDFNNQLRSVLVRFREGPIAFAADIKAMFNNFCVPPPQKDLLRFFWFKDNNPDNPLIPFRSKSHIFGCVSSPAVSNCGLKFLASLLPTTKAARSYLDRNFYVDDGLYSTDSPSSAVSVLKETMDLLSSYNMKLHKIISNSDMVLKCFPDDVKSTVISTLPSENPNCSTLGVQWNTVTDEFILIPEIPSRPFTKRGILSTINSLFDPIGLAAPVVLTGRIIQRRILLNNNELDRYDWDDVLPQIYFEEWTRWISCLEQLSTFKIPRSYYPKGFIMVKQELHAFSDASESATGYVIYMRSFTITGEINVSFVTASSRLAPRAATTIPRLELNAAVEMCKGVASIVIDLERKPDSVCLYTDSKIVHGYLSNKRRRFSKYVERRISVIDTLFDSSHWSYVNTKLNPADLASRPSFPSDIHSSIWFEGPSFLWDPKYSQELQSPAFHMAETLPEEVIEVKALTTNRKEVSPIFLMSQRTNSYNKLLNSLKIVFRFVHSLDLVRQRMGYHLAPRLPFLADDNVTVILIKSAQSDCFSDLVSKLKNGSQLSEHDKLSALAPQLDCHGLIRVGGRLKNAKVAFSVKHPILVPQDHPISSIIIHHFHKLNKHQGSHITHNSIIQNGFHIQNGRKLIRKHLKDCVTCRKLR